MRTDRIHRFPIGLALVTLAVGCNAPRAPQSPVGLARIQLIDGPSPRAPDEIAFSDGDDPWQLVQWNGSAVTIPVTNPDGRYGVATTYCDPHPQWGAPPYCSTWIELQTLQAQAVIQVGWQTVNPSVPVAAAQVTVHGLTPSECLWAAFAGGFDFGCTDNNATTAASSLPAGEADLLVLIAAPFNVGVPQVLVRRGQTLSAGSNLDLDARDAVALETLTGLVGGLRSSEYWQTDSWLWLANTGSAAVRSSPELGNFNGTSGTMSALQLPAALRDPRDSFGVEVSALRSEEQSDGTQLLVEWRILAVDGPTFASGLAELPPSITGGFALDEQDAPTWSWSLGEVPEYVQFSVQGFDGELQRSLAGVMSPAWSGGLSFTAGDTSLCPLLDANARVSSWTHRYWSVWIDWSQASPTCSRSGGQCSSASSGTLPSP